RELQVSGAKEKSQAIASLRPGRVAEGIRTPDPQSHNLMLDPTELQPPCDASHCREGSYDPRLRRPKSGWQSAAGVLAARHSIYPEFRRMTMRDKLRCRPGSRFSAALNMPNVHSFAANCRFDQGAGREQIRLKLPVIRAHQIASQRR